MKIRNGFVSNSSSSSFIIEGGDVIDIASRMLSCVLGEDPDWPSEEIAHRWRHNLESASRDAKVKDGSVGITFPSCNYDTYILKEDNKVYIATCNNTDWSCIQDDASWGGGGADYGDEDECYKRVEKKDFFDLRNGLIHSCDKYPDDWNKYPKCPEPDCKGYYGQYVIMDGQKICGACYKGVLGGKKKKAVKTKNIKLTNKELDELINGLACSYDQSQDLDTDLALKLTLKLKELRKQNYDA